MTFNKFKSNPPTVKLLGTIKGVVIAEVCSEPNRSPRRCVKCRSCFEIRKRETRCPRCRHFARTWKQIQSALLLPAELEKTPLAKCRPLRYLLDVFIECFPRSEQKFMTDEEIKYRVCELPDLPPVFAKLLKENDNENDGADANILPLLDYKKLRRRNKFQAPARRQPVSPTLFAEVAKERGSFCFWCGVKVVRIAHIPQENRLKKNNSTITYLSVEGKLCIENLVISCYPCNQKRERQEII